MMLLGVTMLAQAGVTFSAPAAPAARLLPELGKAMGVPMEAAPALAREVLLVNVKSVTVSDLMKRLAAVTGGEWEARQSVYRLTLSSGTHAKERRAEAIERGEAWRRAIAIRLDARRKNQYSDGNLGLADNAIEKLSAETLGSLGFKERIVFSTRPSAMQRPLPLATIRNLDLSKLSKVDGPTLSAVSAPAAGTIAVVEFAVQPTSGSAMLLLSLLAADANGRTVGAATSNLYCAPSVPERTDEAKLPRPEAKLNPSSKERSRAGALVAMDANSRFYDRIDPETETGETMAMYSDADLAAPSAASHLPEILQPETIEPLSLTAGPLLTSLAQSQGQNLVADLPDNALVPARALLAASDGNAGTVARAVTKTMGVDLEVSGSWIVAHPHAPATARSARLDRAALGVALRSLAKDGTLSLDAQAEYAAAQPIVAPPDTFEAAIFGTINPSFGKRILTTCTSGERFTLRLYRALGSMRKNEARPFGSLPQAAKKALYSLVYDSFGGPTRSIVWRDSKGRGVSTYGGGPMSPPWTLALERTDYWGTGIPKDASLTAVESTSSAMFGLAPNGARPRVSEYAGGYSISRSGNNPAVVATAAPRLERYVRGTVRRITLRLNDPAGASLTRTLEEERIDPGSSVIPYSDLSEATRKTIESTEEEVRKALDQMQPRSGSGKP